jgi:hypothetical protein
MPLAHIIPRRRGAPPLLISPVLLLLPLMQAFADADDSGQSRAQSLDPVLVTAQALRGPQSAPSQGSLVATQPQSIVGADFIRNNDAPAANYTDIIKFTPSVWTISCPKTSAMWSSTAVRAMRRPSATQPSAARAPSSA